MKEDFKINIFYNETGDIEDIIFRYLINLLKEKINFTRGKNAL